MKSSPGSVILRAEASLFFGKIQNATAGCQIANPNCLCNRGFMVYDRVSKTERKL
jgi:hypothetical protein